MNSVCLMMAGGIHDTGDIQIAVNVRRFIRFAHVERRSVSVGIHGDRTDAHLTQGPDDP
jgi:hypothetical protein